MLRIHHVNLHVPPDGLEAQSAFLTDVLGFTRAPAPPELADRVTWFDDEDGVQIHLSVVDTEARLDPGHVAVVLGDRFDEVLDRLEATGQPSRERGAIVQTSDPSGNKWELRRA
jgi:catechol 2,3-dioxygenase-like lactoylglutathione lyase family enzyme